MPINDNTSFASRMNPNRNNDTYLGNREAIDDIVSYAEEKATKSIKRLDKLRAQSWKSQKKTVEELSKDLEKASKSFSDSFKKSFGSSKLSSFMSSLKDYNKAKKSLDPNNAKSIENYAKAGQAFGEKLGAALKKATDLIIKQYSDYAKTYSRYLTTTSTNLGTTRSGYSNLLQGANQNLYSGGYSGTVSMEEVMSSMNELAQSGIASNLEELSVINALSDKISSTFDPSTIYAQLRTYGSDSGLFQLQVGSEAMLRDALQEQFGDSQYVQLGMYKSTKQAIQVLINTQKTAEESAEYEYAIQSGIGQLVEAGLSEKSLSTIQQGLADLANKGYTDNPLLIQAMQQAGVDMSKFASGTATKEDWSSVIGSVSGVLSDYQTDNVIAAGSMADFLGTSTQDIINGEKLNSKLVDLESGIASADSIYDYFDAEAQEAKKRQTFEQNIQNQLQNIIGLLGGNFIAQIGGGVISAVGGMLAGGIGKGVGSLLSVGGSMIAGKGLMSAIKGGGSKLLGGAKTVLSSTGAKVLGGVGGGIAAIADGTGAVANDTYGGGAVGNFLGGAVMGNQSGDESFGGYAKAGLSNAAKGAAIGTIFGPIGTLVGGAIGGIAGLIGNAVAANKKKSEEATGTTTRASSDDSSSMLNTINQSINIQTDKLIVALSNMYLMLESALGANGISREVVAGNYISK